MKFDYRYHIIVRSFRPLEAFAMKRFWPKLAVEEYDIEVRIEGTLIITVDTPLVTQFLVTLQKIVSQREYSQ